MKKLLSIISICFAVSLTSCSSEKDIDVNTNGGKGLEFVHFDGLSDSWLVSETDTSYTFNVPLYQTFKSSAPQTYDIMLGEGTTEGAEGNLFTLASDKVTIPAGEYEGTIQIEVNYANIPSPDNTGFAIQLVCDTDKINPSYGRAYMISVKSDKIVMDWDWLVGRWTAQDDTSEPGDTYTMEIVKVNDTTANFIGEWACSGAMRGIVDFDARTVTFTGEFDLDEMQGGILKVRPADESGKFTATLSPLGIVIDNMNFYISGGDYDGFDLGDDRTILTK